MPALQGWASNVLQVQLSEEAARRLVQHLQEVLLRNREMNLTGIRDFKEALIKMPLDALAALPLLENSTPGERLVDIGSGAGYPGLALCLAGAPFHFALLEAMRKRASFLQALVQKFGLAECVEVVSGRAEELGKRVLWREAAEVVTVRAVAPLIAIVEYGLPLCRIGGCLIAWKGPAWREEYEAAAVHLNLLGGRLERVVAYELPERRGHHVLLLIRKERATPSRYPRAQAAIRQMTQSTKAS